MKKLKIALLLLFLLSAFFVLTSCTDKNNPDNGFIRLSVTSVNFENLGSAKPISAEIVSADNDPAVTWSSSNPEVAVYENGYIRPVGYGVCLIRASYKNYSSACAVTIKNPYSSVYLPTKLFNFNSIGEVAQISAFWGDTNITSNVDWVSSNPNVATCNENGIITSHGYGACLILARSSAQTTVASVIVTDPLSNKLTLSEKSLSLELGESRTLTAELSDDAGSEITWISSNPEIAECDGGVVTAVGDGICTVIAITELGVSDAVTVRVGAEPPKPNIPENLLDFKLPSVPEKLHTTNPETGEIISTALVTSYTVEPTLDEEDGRLYIQMTLNCTKIFDSEGVGGLTPVHIATNLYKENNEYCERRLYKTDAKRVGDEFSIECALFSVQTAEGTLRTFYMTFDNICEK